MKSFSASTFTLWTLISVAVALPSQETFSNPRDRNGPLRERTQITAFTVNKDGKPNVECWEMKGMTMMPDGSGGMRLMDYSTDTREDRMNGITLESWPPHSIIYPRNMASMDGMRDETPMGLEMAHPSLMTVKGGLVAIQRMFRDSDASIDSPMDEMSANMAIFDNQNGDDWFYFEDRCMMHRNECNEDGNQGRETRPFRVLSVGNAPAEILRMRFEERPSYRMLHHGACGMSGVKVPGLDMREEL